MHPDALFSFIFCLSVPASFFTVVASMLTNEKIEKKAKITVLHNGVVVQHGVDIPGMLGHKKTNPYRVHGPGHIQLQDHGNPVRYRNIWVRELNQTQ